MLKRNTYLLNIHIQLLYQMIKDVLTHQANRTFKEKKQKQKNKELEKFELIQFTAYLRHVFNQKSSLCKQ